MDNLANNVFVDRSSSSAYPTENLEAARLEELNLYQIYGTPPEPLFDDLVEVVRIRFDTPIAVISFVGECNVHFKARVGTDLEFAPRESTFCDQTIRQDLPVVVHQALDHEKYKDCPFVTGPPYVQFYAGVPIITPKGHAIGAVSVVDTIPRSPSRLDYDFLYGVARLAMSALEMRRQSRELIEMANRMKSITKKIDEVCGEADGESLLFLEKLRLQKRPE
jgi:GAF domain-containing protein